MSEIEKATVTYNTTGQECDHDSEVICTLAYKNGARWLNFARHSTGRSHGKEMTDQTTYSRDMEILNKTAPIMSSEKIQCKISLGAKGNNHWKARVEVLIKMKSGDVISGDSTLDLNSRDSNFVDHVFEF